VYEVVQSPYDFASRTLEWRDPFYKIKYNQQTPLCKDVRVVCTILWNQHRLYFVLFSLSSAVYGHDGHVIDKISLNQRIRMYIARTRSKHLKEKQRNRKISLTML
jgi:hypothetical protein